MPRLKYYNYNTEQWENVIVGAQGDTGPGVPAGGTAGQIVSKIDGTDFNTEWIDNYTSQVKHLVKAGEALTKGQAVYISSANGTNMIASKANNTIETTSSKTIGLVAQDLANNAEGFVITEGLLSGIDTHTATAGDPVWLGPNGALLFGASNKPVAPAHMVFLGIVTNAHNNGEIFVKVQNGFELDELHDVSITSPAAGDIVIRNSANTLWENQTLAEAGVSEVGHTHDDRYYTESETDTAISNAIAGLVDTAPATLDTLNELAAAINDDASFAATVTTALGTKSDTGHTHDDRYYTETETDNLLSAKANLSGATFTGPVLSSYGGTSSRVLLTNPTAGTDQYLSGITFSNDTGYKVSHFLNSSTRTADGGINGYTIRNDGGPLNLGHPSYQTVISGNISMPQNPAFHAYGNQVGTTTYSANSTIIFENTRYNIGNNYNTATSRFTAPVAGVYLFWFEAFNQSGTEQRVAFKVNGNVAEQIFGQGQTSGSTAYRQTVSAKLNAGDYISVMVAYNSTSIYKWTYHNEWGGCLLFGV